MKALKSFIVHLENNLKDTIKTSGGLELYVDTRFNEFEHRVTSGVVMSTPAKYETPVKEGDTIYFHHLVVLDKLQLMPGTEDKYMVNYHPDIVTSNQAIAMKCKETGDITPLAGWALLEPTEEVKEEQEGVVQLVDLKEKPVTKGVISFRVDELDLDKGSVVGFKKNRDYRIEIDGKEYYRVALSQILYEEVYDD